MRVAIVSDIHGNLTALEAVLRDLRGVAPDVVLHGGDLADGGGNPVEVVDRIRDLGWQGVMGNTDEMLFRPEALTEFAERSAGFRALLGTVQEMAATTRDLLGAERVAWLSGLPMAQELEGILLVHATPGDAWRTPGDGELEALGKSMVVYGHTHVPWVKMTVANSGSVGLPYDGDRRASYLVVDGGEATVRRVEYDVEAEVKKVMGSGRPHAEWVARMLERGGPVMPTG